MGISRRYADKSTKLGYYLFGTARVARPKSRPQGAAVPLTLLRYARCGVPTQLYPTYTFPLIETRPTNTPRLSPGNIPLIDAVEMTGRDMLGKEWTDDEVMARKLRKILFSHASNTCRPGCCG